MLHRNGKWTPYALGIGYHPSDDKDEFMTDTVATYKKLVGDIRYLVDFTTVDLSFAAGRLRAAMAELTTRHCN